MKIITHRVRGGDPVQEHLDVRKTERDRRLEQKARREKFKLKKPEEVVKWLLEGRASLREVASQFKVPLGTLKRWRHEGYGPKGQDGHRTESRSDWYDWLIGPEATRAFYHKNCENRKFVKEVRIAAIRNEVRRIEAVISEIAGFAAKGEW